MELKINDSIINVDKTIYIDIENSERGNGTKENPYSNPRVALESETFNGKVAFIFADGIYELDQRIDLYYDNAHIVFIGNKDKTVINLNDSFYTKSYYNKNFKFSFYKLKIVFNDNGISSDYSVNGIANFYNCYVVSNYRFFKESDGVWAINFYDSYFKANRIYQFNKQKINLYNSIAEGKDARDNYNVNFQIAENSILQTSIEYSQGYNETMGVNYGEFSWLWDKPYFMLRDNNEVKSFDLSSKKWISVKKSKESIDKYSFTSLDNLIQNTTKSIKSNTKTNLSSGKKFTQPINLKSFKTISNISIL